MQINNLCDRQCRLPEPLWTVQSHDTGIRTPGQEPPQPRSFSTRRCAIYARVSVSSPETGLNSLQAQVQACEAAMVRDIFERFLSADSMAALIEDSTHWAIAALVGEL